MEPNIDSYAYIWIDVALLSSSGACWDDDVFPNSSYSDDDLFDEFFGTDDSDWDDDFRGESAVVCFTAAVA
ncbi:hypothetical protein PI124_g6771 [Phytophthora idaei]|nr:hypothetical protein PI125_g5719 [Phytophthora idaei]KAG3162163.1 hypothetical protein PI126_g6094 [Phytophthora idaei]KAG3248540.1 hypothetical protein PI124_g6771 [Phytophthora idaei]